MQKIYVAAFLVLALALTVSVAFAQSPQAANPNPAVQTQAVAQEVSPQLQNVQAGRKDAPAEIQHAVEKLQGARSDLAQAGGEWGGHKATAMAKIDEALRELQIAADWARSHGKY